MRPRGSALEMTSPAPGVGDFSVGPYSAVARCSVKAGADPSAGHKLLDLDPGTFVQIVEVVAFSSRVRGRLARGGWISLSDDERPTMRWVERLVLPARFRIDAVVHVKETKDLTSAHKGDIPKLTEVDVLEVAVVSEQQRVRARVAAPVAGWFSFQSTDTGQCWATHLFDPGPGGVRRYLVDSGKVATGREGVTYRLSRDLEDRDRSEIRLARYGTVVSGIPDGDAEWLQVGDRHLPFRIKGRPVLLEISSGDGSPESRCSPPPNVSVTVTRCSETWSPADAEDLDSTAMDLDSIRSVPTTGD